MLLFDFSRPYHYYVPMFVDCMPSSRLSISLLRYSPNPNLKFVSFNRCILLFDPFMWESKSKSSAMVHHGFAWTIGYPGLELQVGLRATRRVLGRFIGSWSPLLKMPWMWHPSSIYPDLCRNLLLVATMACGYHPGSHIIMMLGFVYIYIYFFVYMYEMHLVFNPFPRLQIDTRPLTPDPRRFGKSQRAGGIASSWLRPR